MKSVKARLKESIEVKKDFADRHAKDLKRVARCISECFKAGGKLLIMGNGGSAADAQHMAAEFTGRFHKDRQPFPAIALTTDTSAITAIGNDYSFEDIFSRQIKALIKPNDVVFAISTSGNSKNVTKAVGMLGNNTVIGLTGGNGGTLGMMSDITLNARLGKDSATIQETHIWAIHTILFLFEKYYL